jgi:hypothetical protein
MAYSPSYGNLFRAQGIIGLFTRFGMDVVLAPRGIHTHSEVEEIGREERGISGGS